MIGSVVLTQCQCVTDRQTDGVGVAINIVLCIAVFCVRVTKTIETVDLLIFSLFHFFSTVVRCLFSHILE